MATPTATSSERQKRMTTSNNRTANPTRYGLGSVYFDDRKGLWVGAIELERGPDGRRRRKLVKVKGKPGARAPKALLDRMTAVQNTIAEGGPLPDEVQTVGSWVTHWADNVVPTMDLAPGTVADYQWLVTKYLVPRLGRVKLAKLTAEHVEKMMAAMRAEGLSPRTIAYTRAVLRLALRTAEARGQVARNAAALTRAPKKSATKLDDSLDAEGAAAVLAAAEGDRLGALAVLVLGVGLRQGEALRLRWSDVDLDGPKPTLTVSRAKTASGVRTVALPAFVVAALDRHQRQQRRERMAAEVWGDPNMVFASTVGTRLDPRNVLRWWHDLCDRAGVGRRRFHATRHTAATLMLNNGVPLEVVSATLGHAGLSITADVYAKVGKQMQREAADTMQQVLGVAPRRRRRASKQPAADTPT